MGTHKELFDELRLNKDLHKRYKEESVTRNKSKKFTLSYKVSNSTNAQITDVCQVLFSVVYTY